MGALRAAIDRFGGLAVGALAGSLLLGAASANADGRPGLSADDARKAHAEADLNHDGMIDREEFYRRIMDVFYLNDADKNGYLSADELVAIQESAVLAPADQNHDGKLTPVEYMDQRFEAFRDADTNSDGLLSVDEVVAFYTSQ